MCKANFIQLLSFQIRMFGIKISSVKGFNFLWGDEFYKQSTKHKLL
jgi:hypothetical protein